MKDKTLIVKVDEDFTKKVDYLKQINGYKNRSETIRKTVEKEWRKENTLYNLSVSVESGGMIMPIGKEKEK